MIGARSRPADGVHVLDRLAEDLSAGGMQLTLATVRGPVRDLIGRSHAAVDLGDLICPDIPSAVARIAGDTSEWSFL